MARTSPLVRASRRVAKVASDAIASGKDVTEQVKNAGNKIKSGVQKIKDSIRSRR